jgi:glycosyltransferase involved in cell wall biosynthesis
VTDRRPRAEASPGVHPNSPVDIVIPLFNKAGSLERAVRSVLRQTHSDWSLVVADDGSTDGGAARFTARFPDERIRLVNQPNQGPGAARNHGVAMGSADLVAFLDADDEWMPTYLEAAVGALRSEPGCAAVSVGTYRGPGRAGCLTEHDRPGLPSGVWRCPTALEPSELKRAVDTLTSSSTVVRRAVFEEFGGFYDRDRCTYAEDSYLWLRLLLREPVYRISEPLTWLHTEDSDLGPGRRDPYPIPPVLKHVDELLAECPASHRELLARYLDWYTWWIAARLADQGEGRVATSLLRIRKPDVADVAATTRRRVRFRARLWPLLRLRRHLAGAFAVREAGDHRGLPASLHQDG